MPAHPVGMVNVVLLSGWPLEYRAECIPITMKDGPLTRGYGTTISQALEDLEEKLRYNRDPKHNPLAESKGD